MRSSISFHKRTDSEFIADALKGDVDGGFQFSVEETGARELWEVFWDDQRAGFIGLLEIRGVSTLRFFPDKQAIELDNSRIKAFFYGLFCTESFLISAVDYLEISEHVDLNLPRIAARSEAMSEVEYVNGSTIFVWSTVVRRLFSGLRVRR